MRLDVSHLKELYKDFTESRESVENASAVQSSVFNQMRSKDAVTREWDEMKVRLRRSCDGCVTVM